MGLVSWLAKIESQARSLGSRAAARAATADEPAAETDAALLRRLEGELTELGRSLARSRQHARDLGESYQVGAKHASGAADTVAELRRRLNGEK